MNGELISGRWWISDGEDCQPNSVAFRPMDTLTACQELGVVVLDRYDCSVILQWDVDRANPSSIDRVCRYLDESADVRRVNLRFYKNGWCSETYWSTVSAIARFSQVCSHRNLDGLAETVIEDKELSRAETSEPLIQAAFSASRQGDFINLVHTLGLQKYAVVLGKNGRYDRLKYMFIGQGSEFFETYGAAYSTEIIGKGPDLMPHPDACENRLSLAYETCLDTGEPIYQHTRANLRFDGTRNWRSFQRILVPVKENTEMCLVYSFAKFTDEIDIPFLGKTGLAS